MIKTHEIISDLLFIIVQSTPFIYIIISYLIVMKRLSYDNKHRRELIFIFMYFLISVITIFYYILCTIGTIGEGKQ